MTESLAKGVIRHVRLDDGANRQRLVASFPPDRLELVDDESLDEHPAFSDF